MSGYLQHFVLILMLFGVVPRATAQQQSFRIRVPVSAVIEAPSSAVQIVHDESDADQSFPPQYWSVRGTYAAGMRVSFSTQHAFTHTENTDFRRDAKIQLAIKETDGPGMWNIDQSEDSTQYRSNDELAIVSASSNGIGRAKLAITVSFLTEEFGDFLPGDYQTQVVGTVTSN